MSDIEEVNSDSSGSKNFCGFNSVDEFSKEGMRLIMEATKAVNALPSGSSRDLYSAHPSFSKVMSQQSTQILEAIHSVIKMQGIKGNIVRRDKEEKFEILQECNDTMLERVNSNLDEIAGIRKKTAAVLAVTEVKASPVPNKYQLSTSLSLDKTSSSSPQTAKLITAKNIMRPQVNFTTPVDNSNNPFVPRLKDKPNSLKPLAILPEYDEDRNITSYLHPYEVEIEKFDPSGDLMKEKTPQIATDINDAPYNYVDTVSKLQEMLKDLKAVKEIAVDLEHHSYRTFLGITCLMQISTRSKDFVIDTIALREDLHILNEVFTNSSIVKVFHGADSDVEWLQRDLSLYLVNMFDTHQASKRLGFARLSLAFLLKHYCNIDADKTFQLADWRMRPLPEQLMKYAQQDTHYLLYIYDMMTNDLLKAANGQPNLLKTVFMDSKIVCLKRYVKPVITIDSHKDLYLKFKRSLDNRQLFALQEIFAWRDKIARMEDESNPYVLPNHMLLHIAETLPREMQGILACCNPIPPLVRQHLNIIHQIILKAREQPLIKPMTNEGNLVRTTVNLNDKKDLLNHPLYCPHDLSHQTDRDDLPTLIGSKEIVKKLQEVDVLRVTLSVFDKSQQGLVTDKDAQMQFISPYNRYKLMIPFMEEQKKKELAAEEEKKKQMLEEKRKQLPELQIVKISDHDIYQVPLKELKKRPFSQDPNESTIPISNKRWKKETAKAARAAVTPEPELETIVIEDSPRSSGKKNKNKGKPQKPAELRQSSNKAVNFDYSQANYQRFQGGSGSISQQNNGFQQKFKGGSKKGKEQLDRMFSFSNFRLNKKK